MLRRLFPTAAQSRAQKEFDRIKHDANRESRKAARICINTLERLRFDHFLRAELRPGFAAAMVTGRRGHQKVRFSHRRADQTTIYLKVDVEHLPWGVKSVDFLEPYIERELGLALSLPTKIHWSIRHGLWIVITRDGSLAGIPQTVSYEDALPEIAKDAPILQFVMGMAEGKQWVKYNLARAPHMIVAGTTRAGKSVFVNQMVLTMVRRASPEQLKLWLIDLKGGVELTMFEGLPHVDKFVTEAQAVESLVDDLLFEVNRREKEVKGKAKNIDGWNQLQSRQKDKKWSRILLIIDEYAQLKGQGAGAALKKLNMILAKGGAFGIHVVIATQVPNRDVISPLVKNNISVRVAFNCASNSHSINIIESGAAFGLNNQGRFIFSLHGELSQIQGPFLEDHKADKMVEEIKAYWSESRPGAGEFDFDRLLRYSLEHMSGQLPMRRIAQVFSGEVSRYVIETYLAEIEGTTVTVDGRNYMVLANDPRTPRRLMPLFETSELAESRVQSPAVSVETGDT